jgi:hypothetical protein
MTEIINKYQGGKIYKIVCRVTNLGYIGSTTQKYLSDRLKGHVYKFKTKTSSYTSFKVLEGGDYYIELLELFPCNSKDELLVRERYYFDVIDCVNKLRPKTTVEEKKEQKKEWIDVNKDKITEYNEKRKGQRKEYYKQYDEKREGQKKEYYKQNKEAILLKQKQYNEDNKDKVKEQKKIYNENNKEKKKEYDKQKYLKMKQQNQSSSALTI